MCFPIPYVRRTIRMPFSDSIVIARLKEVVIPREGWWDSSVALTGDFEGRVTPQGFAIRRVLGYRNSFAPTLYGTFVSGSNHSRIDIKISMHPLIILFMSVWFGLILVVMIMSLLSNAKHGKWDFGALIPLGMLLVGYAMASIGYSIEATRLIRFLDNIGNGETQTV